jgi:hypothetical protein
MAREATRGAGRRQLQIDSAFLRAPCLERNRRTGPRKKRSLLKRSILGSYQHPSVKHLFRDTLRALFRDTLRALFRSDVMTYKKLVERPA